MINDKVPFRQLLGPKESSLEQMQTMWGFSIPNSMDKNDQIWFFQ